MKRNVFILISALFLFNSCNKNNPSAPKILSGTTWVVTRVDFETTNTSQTFNDTISFIDDSQYTHNQNTRAYNIGSYNAEPNYYFLWEDCTLFGDDIEARVNPDIITQGDLNGIEFNQVISDNAIYVWMHKI